MQNGIGVKTRLDVRELAIQFGCVRLVSFVQKGLFLYKDRFLAALPASRRANTDFSRPVFTAVAFYLCAKKHMLKVDKFKLIELCGTSESEFITVANSMNDLCFDVIGTSKEKKDSRSIKGHQELLEALPGKMMRQDHSDVSDDSSLDIDDDIEIPSYKRRKQMEKKEYNEWKSSVIFTNENIKKGELLTGPWGACLSTVPCQYIFLFGHQLLPSEPYRPSSVLSGISNQNSIKGFIKYEEFF